MLKNKIQSRKRPKIFKEFCLSYCQAPSLDWISKPLLCKEKFFYIANETSLSDIENFLEVFHHSWEEEFQYRIENLRDNIKEEDLFNIDNIKEIILKNMYLEILKEAYEEVIENLNRPDIVIEDLRIKESYIFSGSESILNNKNGQIMNYLDILHNSGIISILNRTKPEV